MKFENVREVEIRATNGRIEIEGWENDHVEVNYTVHGEANVEVEQKGSKLIIREEPKKRRVLGLFEKSLGGWAEIEMRIPRSVLVRARNVNGELKARGACFGDVTTVNGEISIENCEAEKLSSVNGGIRAHLTVAGPLQVKTVNGEIELTIEELEGDVEVSCVNGDITLRLTEFCDARIIIKRVSGDVKFVGIDPDEPVIGTGEFRVKVSTVNGDVRVELI
ncbi:DUF4097 family beta strand repeat-containing protein [Pyrococcus yayanosii]|uniref:DUF4097 domain-containing protein n=1 Tax=Pyrococcus yayanosii (strain CH1 / JCM 16557) TaxID=529709 RepID=F8AIN1_PYRYC|nr:DUF4097 family beta strand repeat-containing protein [Pyrococcus yayanosii]AEH24403.1 hypothetical protein PYCH_07150 [Pyrococcus yayanosii CH1]